MPSTAERILVVESDPDISDVIARQALKPLGYDVQVVADVSQALRDALAIPPDLIIADLNLPDLSAQDLLTALSSQGVTAPLVVIADKGDERHAIQAFRLGAADALLWPVGDAEVVRVVERALQQPRSGRLRQQLSRQIDAAHRTVQRKTGDLNELLSLSKAILSITDHRQLLGRLLDSALRIAEADIAWFMLREEESQTFYLKAYRNLPPAWAKKLNQPMDDGLSSLVSLSGQALTIHGLPMEQFKVAGLGKSAVVLPLKVHDEVLGILIVIRKADREFDKDLQVLLEGIADFGSISVVNSRLFQVVDVTTQSARDSQRSRNALLDALRAAVRDEVRVSAYPLEKLASGDPGTMTADQKEAVATVQTSLRRLARAADRTTPTGRETPAERI